MQSVLNGKPEKLVVCCTTACHSGSVCAADDSTGSALWREEDPRICHWGPGRPAASQLQGAHPRKTLEALCIWQRNPTKQCCLAVSMSHVQWPLPKIMKGFSQLTERGNPRSCAFGRLASMLQSVLTIEFGQVVELTQIIIPKWTLPFSDCQKVSDVTGLRFRTCRAGLAGYERCGAALW